MIVELKTDDGERLTLDVSAVSASEWKMVREYTGQNPMDLFDAVGRMEIEAVEALYWLVQRKNHKPAFNIGSAEFELLGFLEQWQTGESQAAAKAADAEKAPKARKTRAT